MDQYIPVDMREETRVTFDGIHTDYGDEVKYPYADVGAPNLLHIREVNNENRRAYEYECPCCKKRLRPRLGTKRQHCFFHDKGTKCSIDKYIHDTAERLLKEKWDKDEPFEISMVVAAKCRKIESCPFSVGTNVRNCVSRKMETFNLKEHYQTCLVEKKYGEFVPDLLLLDETGAHEPIFIEIWSKHKNSQKKADSKYKIIEIRLKTPEELETLTEGPITESETVTFSHFESPVLRAPEKFDGVKVVKYTLYESMKSHYDEIKGMTCGNCDMDKCHRSKALMEVFAENPNNAQFRYFCNVLARDHGYDVQHCYSCRNYRAHTADGEESQETVPMCQKTPNGPLEQCHPDPGMKCESFAPRNKWFNDLRMQFACVPMLIRYRNGEEWLSEIRKGPLNQNIITTFETEFDNI